MSYSEEAVQLTEDVKEKALASGAELVGVISSERVDDIPKHWIGWIHQAYTKKTKDYLENSRSVLVLGYQVWDDMHELVTIDGNTAEYPAYQRIRLYARRVLRFLQRRGHRAVVYPYFLPTKKMAQLAGLGSFGKNSMIVSPDFGPWFRIQTILTEAELVPTSPYDEDLCGECEKCIEACPVEALTPYRIDPDKCLLGIYGSIWDDPEFRSVLDEHMPDLTKNSFLMCMACQKACPYGRAERGLDVLQDGANATHV
jgi:epoxyqueuosine reductase QueG